MITLQTKDGSDCVRKPFAFAVIILISMSANAQIMDSPFYRHSLQVNVAGLGFERWATAYQLSLTPRHALFVQGGGSYPGYSKEKEYGFGAHYRFFLERSSEARFLWLFKSARRNSFLDFNGRYMKLDGIHKDVEWIFEAYYVGAGWGQSWDWNSGFTISYWLGYGPPIGGVCKWKNSTPEDGEAWAKMYKWASGLDFGLAIGYSFGRRNN